MDLSNFYIFWVEHCSYPFGKNEPGVLRHKHEFFHYIYVDDGEGEITIAGKPYPMIPGNIYLLPPFVEHAFHNTGNVPLRSFEIKFQLNDTTTAESMEKLPFCADVSEYPIRLAVSTIYEETKKNLPLSSKIINLNFQLLFNYLLRYCENPSFSEASDIERKFFSPEIDSVINYILENLADDLSLDILAKVAGFEKNYFLRKFRRETCRTPMNFIREKRIKKAKELLRFSDMNISQVALAVGFQSIHYFSKVFYESTGVRPLNYKNENGIS